MTGALVTLIVMASIFIYKYLKNERKDQAANAKRDADHVKELESFYNKNVYLQTVIDNQKEDLENYRIEILQLNREIDRLKKYEEREKSRKETSAEVSAYNEGFEDGYQMGLDEPEKEAYKIGFMHGHQHGMEDERAGKEMPDYDNMMDRAEESYNEMQVL